MPQSDEVAGKLLPTAISVQITAGSCRYLQNDCK